MIQKTAIITTPLPAVEIEGTGSKVLDLEVSEGASVTASSESASVATVTAANNKITITGVAAGNTLIKLVCAKTGEASSERTIMVSVV